MAKILAPNKEYTGVSASVSFCNGIGETENSNLIEWFKEHEYEVMEDVQKPDKSFEDMSAEELMDYAKEHEIDIGKATSQSGIIEKIKEATKTE